MGNSETIDLKTRTGDPGVLSQKSPLISLDLLRCLCIHRQAAAVGMFLRFFQPSK
jgi:hypothetical protein